MKMNMMVQVKRSVYIRIIKTICSIIHGCTTCGGHVCKDWVGLIALEVAMLALKILLHVDRALVRRRPMMRRHGFGEEKQPRWLVTLGRITSPLRLGEQSQKLLLLPHLLCSLQLPKPLLKQGNGGMMSSAVTTFCGHYSMKEK
ncbi:hypothetical protein L484_009499 [Morus notabilis]|uniref:Uncharacterized protein n=1 Tax=Morus notabilis TaxID=981085 RepID=W9RC86_9ROSA|nr:hypothetical protein L484_009499 [Morus notabilis]